MHLRFVVAKKITDEPMHGNIESSPEVVEKDDGLSGVYKSFLVNMVVYIMKSRVLF